MFLVTNENMGLCLYIHTVLFNFPCKLEPCNRPLKPKKIKISFLYPFLQWIEVSKKLIRTVIFELLYFGFFFLPNFCALLLCKKRLKKQEKKLTCSILTFPRVWTIFPRNYFFYKRSERHIKTIVFFML